MRARCLSLAVLLLLAPAIAHAQRTVTNDRNTDPGSLRDALDHAVSGETIRFDASLAGALINLVTPDTRTLGSGPAIPLGPTALVVDGIDVTIDGTDAPGLQIDGASTWRVFVVINGGHLTLRNVTVQNGRAIGGNGGGAGGGGAGGLGGGVFVADGSTLTLDGVTMLQHRALGGAGGGGTSGFGLGCGGGGGGLLTEGEGPVSGALAGAGGGPNGGGRSATYGSPGGDGGGGSGACTTFDVGGHPLAQSGGVGGWGGGGGGGGNAAVAPFVPAVYRWDPGGLGGFGGGGGGNGGVTPTSFPEPTPQGSLWGGGVGGRQSAFGSGGGGGGAGLGGAVFVRGGTLEVVRSTFVANQSVGGAGGRNASSGLGLGAVFVLDGTATIRASTFAGSAGGAIYVLSLVGLSTVTMSETVLAGSEPQCAVEGSGAALASTGHNLIETSSGPRACSFGASDLVSVDPMLGALAANGGPTSTMLPSATSPLLGAGVCPSGDVDQRGRPRSLAPACDIGSVELDRAAVTVVLAGMGSGTVTSDMLGIACGTSCSTRSVAPVSLELTASPAAGSIFGGYVGGGCGGTATCSVTTSTDVTVTATFELAPDAGIDPSSTDAGAHDAGAHDAAAHDAGAGDADASDAAASSARDASAHGAADATPDASPHDGTPPPAAASCACRASRDVPAPTWLVALVALLALRARARPARRAR